tara:strand:+ start:585 stop:1748 length:1164 start_codon:yes stop_codon:yes gene_type:complete
MKIFLPLIITFFCISCSTETSQQEVSETPNEYKPLPNELVRTVVIPNDTILGAYEKVEIGIEGNREVIYASNTMSNLFDNFDLKDAKYIKTTYFNTDPALLNVPLIETVRISEDSIFLYGFGNRIFLVDNEISVINKWDFNQIIDPAEQLATVEALNMQGSVFINNGFLYIRIWPQNTVFSDKLFYEKSFVLEYDIANNKVTRQLGYFPDFMAENSDEFFYNEHQFSWLKSNSDKNKLLVSFRRSHDLMVLDLETEEQNYVHARSNFLDKFPLIPRDQRVQLDHDPIVTNGAYRHLLYDSYREVYYRIVSHDQDQINPLTNSRNHPVYRPYSIIVLDKGLNYIGESTIENYERINVLSAAVCSEGLIFGVKDDDESVVTFDIIKIAI